MSNVPAEPSNLSEHSSTEEPGDLASPWDDGTNRDGTLRTRYHDRVSLETTTRPDSFLGVTSELPSIAGSE